MIIAGIALILSMIFWVIENFDKIIVAGFTFPTMTIAAIWITAIVVGLYLHFSKNDNKDDDENN